MATIGRSATIVPRTEQSIFDNELIIGGGITLLGALIGLLYGLFNSSKSTDPTETDARYALEGALLGLVISLMAVLLYRAYFHSMSVRQFARTKP